MSDDTRRESRVVLTGAEQRGTSESAVVGQRGTVVEERERGALIALDSGVRLYAYDDEYVEEAADV